jgi:hypothetical protein
VNVGRRCDDPWKEVRIMAKKKKAAKPAAKKKAAKK